MSRPAEAGNVRSESDHHSRRLARLLVALACSVGILSLVIVDAHAQFAAGSPAPPPPSGNPPPPGGAVSVEPAASTRQLAVDYYVKRYDVSQSEALRRLELQSRVRELDETLGGRLGRGFAQSFFDNELGRWTIAIGPAGDAAATRGELVRLGFRDDEASIVRVAYDHERLKSAVAALSARLRPSLEKGRSTVEIDAGGLKVQVASAATDQERADIRQAAREGDVTADVSDSPRASLSPTPTTCAFPYCSQLVAGVKYWPSGCTAGFHGRSPVDSRPFMFTAGHCIQAGRAWYSCWPSASTCNWAGTEINGYYGNGGGDAAVMRVDYAWSIYAGFVNWSTTGIAGVQQSDNVSPGRVVCLNGTSSGSSCGTVVDSSWSGVYTDSAYVQ